MNIIEESFKQKQEKPKKTKKIILILIIILVIAIVVTMGLIVLLREDPMVVTVDRSTKYWDLVTFKNTRWW